MEGIEMVQNLASKINACDGIFFVQTVEPVLALEGGVSMGVGPEPTQPLALVAPPDGHNPEGGDPLTFASVPRGEMGIVAAGNQGEQDSENSVVPGEVFFGPPEVLRIAEKPFFGSYAHAGPPGPGGDGCEHGSRGLIQHASAECDSVSSGQVFLLDQIVEQVPPMLNFSGNAFFPENSSSSQDTQLFSGGQMAAEEGGGFPLAQVLECIQQVVPAENFFLTQWAEILPGTGEN